MARDYVDEEIRKNAKKLRKMKDKESVKKFLSNLFDKCQKRYKKNQVGATNTNLLYSKTTGKVGHVA